MKKHLSILLVGCAILCGVRESAAHSGDISFFDTVYQAYKARVEERLRGPVATETLAREMAALFGTVTNEAGRTALPKGTTCDSVTLENRVMTVYFTLPTGASVTEEDVENAGAILRYYFAEPDMLDAIHLLFRHAGETQYRSTAEAIARPARARAEQDDNWFEPNGPGPVPPMSTKEIQAALASEDKARYSGQGPLGTSGQPAGALSGRTVFFSAGHGWTANATENGGNGSWFLQRPLLLSMNEDYGNIDQVNFLAHYLFNAGATVVCMRPIGYQRNEVVLDNTSSDVTWAGAWTDGETTTPVYFGSGTPHRYSVAATTENRTATYSPNIPQAGFYPVYTWVNYGSDRTQPGQLYRILHAGGETQVRVNHQRVGRGWVWLGSYHFNAGKNVATGSVIISNRSATGIGVVIADAIRFGNGMGDISRGANVSGNEREEEASRYWAQRMVGTGMSSSLYNLSGSSDSSDNVGTPPRMAAEMRRDAGQGYNGDIYLGFHSNAAGCAGGPPCTARGCIGLITNTATVTNQPTFAALVADTLEADAQIEDANWDYTFGSRTSTYTSGFGEIGSYLNGEMCGTIIETAFHDNPEDAELLRDPKVRDVMARACYKAILKYFNQFGGATLTYLPEPPIRFRAVTNGSGGVVLSWQAGPTGGAHGHAATGYRVYQSNDGTAYNSGAAVSGLTTTITGLTAGQVYFFRVAATNAGGESMPSETLGVRVSASGAAPVLIVNGYDRIDRRNNIPEYPNNPVDDRNERLFLGRNNAYNYVIQHGNAVAAAGRNFDSCANEAVINSDVNLANYSVVVWICGEESTRDDTFNATEQTRVQNFLNAGKGLFVSGAEIGYELDFLAGGATFYNNFLKADYAGDDGGSYQATGAAGSIFSGLVMNFPASATMYDAEFPDQLSALGGSMVCATYTNGGAGNAAIQYSGAFRVVNFGFPFEGINNVTRRNEVMTAALNFLAGPASSVADWQIY